MWLSSTGVKSKDSFYNRRSSDGNATESIFHSSITDYIEKCASWKKYIQVCIYICGNVSCLNFAPQCIV